MNVQVVSKENNVVKFTFQAGPDKFEEGLQYAYNKNKKNIALPGFRKGKAPRKLIEAQYGEGVFYDDAINYVLNRVYESAVSELDLDVVSKPEIDVTKCTKEEGIDFVAEVTVKPEVTLGQYKELEYQKMNVEVKEEEIEAELKKVQEQNSRMIAVTDRPAQNEDIVTISYSGSIDGEKFDGGTSDSYELTLGSHSFIDTFEEQIVGHSIGDHFDVNVTFPTEYHEASLAGKAAVFAVELKEINLKELPELNDEFAQDVSDYETLDEYKQSIVDKLKTTKENQANQQKSDTLVEKATENAAMDVPQIMIENKIDSMVREFEANLKNQGISLDIYCQYMGTTKEGLRDSFKVPAEKSVKNRLMLEAVAKAENITVTQEELDEYINKIGQSYGMNEEQMKAIIPESERGAIEEDLKVKKAVEIIENSGVEALVETQADA